MKETIKKILIHILFLIFGFILACGTIDSVNLSINNQTSQNGAILKQIEAITPDSTTNENNKFKVLNALLLFDVSDNWNFLYNYYPNEVTYVYNGITIDGPNRLTTQSSTKTFCLQFAFSELILVDTLNQFSINMDNRGLVNRNIFCDVSRDGQTWESLVLHRDIDTSTNSATISFFPQSSSTSFKTMNLVFEWNDTEGVYPAYTSAYFGSVGGEGAYNVGFNNGYYEGYNTGKTQGYNEGYDEATRQGISNPEHVFFTIWSILTTCGDILLMFFTTKVWGDFTLGFVFVIIPFAFTLIERVINMIIKFLGGDR